ncbi:hypothetical protein CLF_102648 [Clonorchis sinensis]|uniref:Uncharacterized protein n=1 Tax=Clonorchis sinensis TaxID=79923 RepID=G7Y8A3_CLOSI|nr:hypothetical protein CLF_102648 [Clonorchis sinensis]
MRTRHSRTALTKRDASTQSDFAHECCMIKWKVKLLLLKICTLYRPPLLLIMTLNFAMYLVIRNESSYEPTYSTIRIRIFGYLYLVLHEISRGITGPGTMRYGFHDENIHFDCQVSCVARQISQ